MLRGWEPLPVLDNDIAAHYRILVSRGNERLVADLYLFNIPDVIPSFSLPLRSPDIDVLLNKILKVRFVGQFGRINIVYL